MNHSPNNHARGATLTEFLLWMIVAMLIVATIFSAYSIRNRDVKVSRLISDHFALVNSVRTIAAGQSDYLTTPWETTLRSANAIPLSISAGTTVGNLTHSLGGGFSMTPQEFQGPSTGGTFPGVSLMRFNYTNLSRGPCIRFAAAVAATSYDTTINGTRVHLLNPPALDQADTPQIATLCTATNNTIQVTQTGFVDVVNYVFGDTPIPIQNTLYPKIAALIAQKASWH
jgi:hypothetical protein